MITLKKLSAGALLGVLALTSTACVRTNDAFAGALPALAAATSEVSKLIAADMTAQFQKAMKAPRPVRVRKSPTVTVSAVVESAIESITVEASRLPIETITVAATRLPVETIVVAATRLPSLVDPTDIAKTVRTAQVRL